jgi:hypothetical protein
MSYSLPFAVFEKAAEVVDLNMISQHATLTRGVYDDGYVRALNAIYPMTDVLGERLIQKLRGGDLSDINRGSRFMLARYDEVIQSIVSAAKTGQWHPRVIPYDQPDAEKHLVDLAAQRLLDELIDFRDTDMKIVEGRPVQLLKNASETGQ